MEVQPPALTILFPCCARTLHNIQPTWLVESDTWVPTTEALMGFQSHGCFFLGCSVTQRPLHTLANQSSRKEARKKQGELQAENYSESSGTEGTRARTRRGMWVKGASGGLCSSLSLGTGLLPTGQPGHIWVMLETSMDGDTSPPAFFFFLISKPNFPRSPIMSSAMAAKKSLTASSS